ncbi:MAG: hypothetical protein AB8F65_15755 [Woeseiaceae bacterium]
MNEPDQSGMVLITTIVLLLMAGLLASVSMRASTLSLSIAGRERSAERLGAVAEAALTEHINARRFSLSSNTVSQTSSYPHDIQARTTIDALGRIPVVQHRDFDANLDDQWVTEVFRLQTTATGPQGISVTRNAVLHRVVAKTITTGDLPTEDADAIARFGQDQWVVAWGRGKG